MTEEEEEEEVDEEEERVGRTVRSLKENKLLMCGEILCLILGGHSYPLQTLNCEQGPLLVLDSLQTTL